MKIDINNFLSHHIKNNIPCAVGKIGTTELNVIYNYLYSPNTILPHVKEQAEYIAGINPLTVENLKKFFELFIESLKCLNVAPRWNKILQTLEQDILNKYTKSYDANLIDFEPQFFSIPWTKYLENKTVLVISPFAESIQQQYKKKNYIWPNKLLPDFNLITVKHPHAGTVDGHNMSIFEIFENIKTEIDKHNFDIGIVGTGGNSIPLTSYIHQKNKIAIHLGGATQILFGIKGKRWDSREEYQKFYNEYWARPLISETPSGIEHVEGGCYW